MKDNFSQQSGAYAKFRPVYPAALYDFICSQVNHFERAWDCGTGNGQVAGVLADRFQEVYATDISQKQLNRAIRKGNIHYRLAAAETRKARGHDPVELIKEKLVRAWGNSASKTIQFYIPLRMGINPPSN
jgi:trans-aconitate methyltransferase